MKRAALSVVPIILAEKDSLEIDRAELGVFTAAVEGLPHFVRSRGEFDRAEVSAIARHRVEAEPSAVRGTGQMCREPADCRPPKAPHRSFRDAPNRPTPAIRRHANLR